MSFFSIQVTSKDAGKVLACSVDNIQVKLLTCINLLCYNKVIGTILN